MQDWVKWLWQRFDFYSLVNALSVTLFCFVFAWMSIVYILHLTFKQISISLSKCILKKDLVIGGAWKFLFIRELYSPRNAFGWQWHYQGNKPRTLKTITISTDHLYYRSIHPEITRINFWCGNGWRLWFCNCVWKDI